MIPFCTSSSSGLGESGELLAELAGSGEWKEGMRFPSNVSDEDVRGMGRRSGEIKNDFCLKKKVLDFMVEKESAIGFMLRDEL